MANALNKVNSGGIEDGSIVNADIKSDAAIALSKLASTPAVLTGSTNNTITTVTSGNNIQGEANLTFDGNTLEVGPAGDARLILHSDTDTNSSAGIILKRGANDTYGADGYTDYSILSEGGDLFISSQVSGNSAVEKLRIDSSGNIGIGTSTPLTPNGSHADNPLNGTPVFTLYGDSPAINLVSSTQTSDDWSLINFGRTGSTTNQYRAAIGYHQSTDLLRLASMGEMTFDVGGPLNTNERLRIDSDGRLLVGHAASRSVGGVAGPIQIEGINSSAAFSITRNSANAHGPYLSLAKTRGGAVGGTTAVQNGDALGQIVFSGADGTDITNNAATITGFIDGTPGSNDTPGRLVFATTADGGTSSTERMRIHANGAITKPTQPSASTYFSGTDPGASGGRISGAYGVPSTTRWNIGGNYSGSTGKFTCPVAGKYVVTFSGNLNLSNLSVSDSFNITTRKNGSSIQHNYDVVYNSGWQHLAFTNIIDCSSNDYLQVFFSSSGDKTFGADNASAWNQLTFTLLL